MLITRESLVVHEFPARVCCGGVLWVSVPSGVVGCGSVWLLNVSLCVYCIISRLRLCIYMCMCVCVCVCVYVLGDVAACHRAAWVLCAVCRVSLTLHIAHNTHAALRHVPTSPSLYSYLLTPRCRVFLEKLTGLQLVKKFPAFHGTRRFITALTSVRHLSLSWASPIQSI